MYYCSKCGKQREEKGFCENCGTLMTEKQTASLSPVRIKRPVIVGDNTFAVAGFVLSGYLPLLALIFSIIGIVKSKKLKGKGRVLGIFGILLTVGISIFNFVFILALLISPTLRGWVLGGLLYTNLIFFGWFL